MADMAATPARFPVTLVFGVWPHGAPELIEKTEGLLDRQAASVRKQLHGELGKALELTAGQKRSIAEREKEVREELMKQTRDVYEEALQELIRVMADTDQEKTRNAMGPQLRYGSYDLKAFAVRAIHQQSAIIN